MKLRYLLFIVLLAVAIIPTILFEAVPHSGAYQKEVADVSERHLLLAQNIGFALERYDQDVKSLFKSLAVNMLAGNKLSDTKNLLAGLSFRHICIATASTGEVIHALNEEVAPCPKIIPGKRLKEFLKTATKDKANFTSVLPGPDGRPFLYVVWLVGDNLSVGAIYTDYIVELGKTISFGKRGHAAIVDHTGRVIAHPLPKWRAEMKDISKILPVKNMLARKTGVEIFYSPALKDDMIAGYTWVKGTNWGVMVPQPVSELHARAKESQQHAISGIATGIFLAALLSWLFAGFLTKPILAVIETAKQLASGNQVKRVETKDAFLPRELNELGTTFNSMSNSVDIAYRRLSRIAESVSTPSSGNIYSVMVKDLSEILSADFTFFGELSSGSNTHIRTISFYKNGLEQENFEYDLADTPCENIVGQRACVFNGDVQQKFPNDTGLRVMGIKSYIGVPVFTSQQVPIGLLVVMNKVPISNVSAILDSLHIYANRLSSEWQHAQNENRLQNAVSVANQANHSKTEFLSNMSHELRTPLNAIIGFSAILAGQLYGPLNNASYREYASDIQHAGQHLLTLIGDLLDISKIEAGELDIDRKEVEIGSAIKESVRMIEAKLNKRHIDIKIDVPAFLPTVYVDALHLRQILINLLSNAVKFTDDNGKISVSAKAFNPLEVSISVTDNGVGIPVADQEKVFEPFGQVANSMTRNHDGVGLGLPIVKSLVGLNGGKIDLHSKPGSGTTVEIFLPVHQNQSSNKLEISITS